MALHESASSLPWSSLSTDDARPGTPPTTRPRLPPSVSERSLENFAQDDPTPPILTSPRSLRACARLGIQPAELIKRPPEQLISPSDRAQLHKELLHNRLRHFERRRLVKLRDCLSERAKIMREGNSSSESDSVSDHQQLAATLSPSLSILQATERRAEHHRRASDLRAQSFHAAEERRAEVDRTLRARQAAAREQRDVRHVEQQTRRVTRETAVHQRTVTRMRQLVASAERREEGDVRREHRAAAQDEQRRHLASRASMHASTVSGRATQLSMRREAEVDEMARLNESKQDTARLHRRQSIAKLQDVTARRTELYHARRELLATTRADERAAKEAMVQERFERNHGRVVAEGRREHDRRRDERAARALETVQREAAGDLTRRREQEAGLQAELDRAAQARERVAQEKLVEREQRIATRQHRYEAASARAKKELDDRTTYFQGKIEEAQTQVDRIMEEKDMDISRRREEDYLRHEDQRDRIARLRRQQDYQRERYGRHLARNDRRMRRIDESKRALQRERDRREVAWQIETENLAATANSFRHGSPVPPKRPSPPREVAELFASSHPQRPSTAPATAKDWDELMEPMRKHLQHHTDGRPHRHHIYSHDSLDVSLHRIKSRYGFGSLVRNENTHPKLLSL